MMSAFLLYYGSFLIPATYLLSTFFRGWQRRAMLIVIGRQSLAHAVVMAFVVWCRSAGYTEWYWATALNIPVNALVGCGYLLTLLCRVQPPDSITSDQP